MFYDLRMIKCILSNISNVTYLLELKLIKNVTYFCKIMFMPTIMRSAYDTKPAAQANYTSLKNVSRLFICGMVHLQMVVFNMLLLIFQVFCWHLWWMMFWKSFLLNPSEVLFHHLESKGRQCIYVTHEIFWAPNKKITLEEHGMK